MILIIYKALWEKALYTGEEVIYDKSFSENGLFLFYKEIKHVYIILYMFL